MKDGLGLGLNGTVVCTACVGTCSHLVEDRELELCANGWLLTWSGVKGRRYRYGEVIYYDR